MTNETQDTIRLETGEIFKCSFDELLPLDELNPNPENPNYHSEEQIIRISEIIKYQGQRLPITVSRLSGLIVRGHGRLEAMKRLNWTRVAVDYQEYSSEDQEYADMVADNAIAEWAQLSISQINLKVPDLGPDLDIEMLGLKNFTLDPSNIITPDSINQKDKTEYNILITLENENACAELFEELKGRNYTCRIIE